MLMNITKETPLCKDVPFLKVRHIERLQLKDKEDSGTRGEQYIILMSGRKIPLVTDDDSIIPDTASPALSTQYSTSLSAHLPLLLAAGSSASTICSTPTVADEPSFDREKAIESCFPASWVIEMQALLSQVEKPDDNMRNEIIRKIVRRVEDAALSHDDLPDIADQALRRLPLLNLKTVNGTEALISQMKKCLRNHEQYMNRQRRKSNRTNIKVSPKALMAAMNEEMEKPTPSLSVLNTLLVNCRRKRQEDAKRASAAKHLRDYPALKINQLLLWEFEALIGLKVTELRNRWIDALPSLMNYYSPKDSTWTNMTYNQQTIAVLLATSSHFKAKFGQKNRSRNIIEMFEEGTLLLNTYPDIDDPPRLIAIGSNSSPSLTVSIYLGGNPVFCGNSIEGLLYLQALYTVFNIPYASEAKVAFVFVAAVLLQKKFEKSYKKFQSIINALEELDLFQ